MTDEERPQHPRLLMGTRTLGSGHCSALIKLLPNNSDLFTSQVTWSSYQSMLRIQKRYLLAYHLTSNSSDVIPGQVSTFSSYPGILGSQDDFYMLRSGLVTQETTIGNNNNKLWKHVKTEESVLEFVRAVVANNLASTGSEWAHYFSLYNSGTYNNQWMVVDYNRFTPRRPLRRGLLTVVEQIPGTIVSGDLTSLLSLQQYWPSYNSPFFTEVFNRSGNQVLVDKFGDWFSYNHTPRANIFRRDHHKVHDVNTMIRLMRYNDFTHDPLSKCACQPPYSAENAISARCDLNPANGSYPFQALGHRDHGATDMKLTTSERMRKMQMISIAGPTHDPLPPFRWSQTDFANITPHQGHPDLFNFEQIEWQWQWQVVAKKFQVINPIQAR